MDLLQVYAYEKQQFQNEDKVCQGSKFDGKGALWKMFTQQVVNILAMCNMQHTIILILQQFQFISKS